MSIELNKDFVVYNINKLFNCVIGPDNHDFFWFRGFQIKISQNKSHAFDKRDYRMLLVKDLRTNKLVLIKQLIERTMNNDQ